MIKSLQGGSTATVAFTLDPRVGARAAAVCGEWNGWSPDIDLMKPDPDGGFSITIDLEAGRSYRFRYLLDGARWENDWAADAYVPNEYGGDDSLVDLTALEDPAPPPAKKAPAKKAPAKKIPAKTSPATAAADAPTDAAPAKAKRSAKKPKAAE